MKDAVMGEGETAVARQGAGKLCAVSVSLLAALLFSSAVYLSSRNLRVWLSNLPLFTAPLRHRAGKRMRIQSEKAARPTRAGADLALY
jgi:hypothetical protein